MKPWWKRPLDVRVIRTRSVALQRREGDISVNERDEHVEWVERLIQRAEAEELAELAQFVRQQEATLLAAHGAGAASPAVKPRSPFLYTLR